jgi:glycosyltransferase involved in cell wall biosynthesis
MAMAPNPRRILIFSDWFLPGFKAGGPIRSLVNLVEALQDDFFIVTRNTDHNSAVPYENIPTNKWLRHAGNVQIIYFPENEITFRKVNFLLSEREYDCIYLNSLYSPRFSLFPLICWRLTGSRQRLVLAPRGMLKEGALSQKRAKKRWFIRLSRLSGIFDGIIWHATNKVEEEEIKAFFGSGARIRIAPNLSARETRQQVHPVKHPGVMKLVCIARISPEKGILEAIRFLKHASLAGDVKVTFYGVQQSADYLGQCRALAASIPDADITFPGEINPTEIPDVLAANHFFYLATLGENYGHAIAEALLTGTPVLISDRTPWRNLEARQAGWDISLDEESFRKALRRCMAMDNQEYQTFCDGAFRLGTNLTEDSSLIEESRRLFS